MNLWIEKRKQQGCTDTDVRVVLDFMSTLFKFGILRVIDERD